MLREYGLEDDSQTVKEWYDGYTFGDENVYCPWDVINYCADHRNDQKMPPQNYWLNTSGNAIVRRFVDMANIQTRNEIEQLIDGKTIIKEIYQELTYNELDSSIDHLWSVLFTTGYLTRKRRTLYSEQRNPGIVHPSDPGMVSDFFKSRSGHIKCFLPGIF